MSDTNAPRPVHAYFVADMSGSMSDLKTDLIGGFNSYVQEQAAKPGEFRLTLVLFNSMAITTVHDAVPIDEVPELTSTVYIPQASTPLLDAEGHAILQAEFRAAARDLAGEPEEVILFVTFTDGRENASREWTFGALTAKKAECEAAGWAFTYLGVGHDAYAQAQDVGTHALATRSSAATAQGMSETYDSVHLATNTARRAAYVGQSVSSSQLYGGDNES